jgi:Flp pilus assembly pilin Flp
MLDRCWSEEEFWMLGRNTARHPGWIWRDARGQTMLDHVIIVAVVVLAGIAVFRVIEHHIKERSISISTALAQGGNGGGVSGGGGQPLGGGEEPPGGRGGRGRR